MYSSGGTRKIVAGSSGHTRFRKHFVPLLPWTWDHPLWCYVAAR